MSDCEGAEVAGVFLIIIVIMWMYFIFWLGEKSLEQWKRQHGGGENIG